MNKVSCLVFHNDYDDFIQRLRELGVVHIKEKKTSLTDDILTSFLKKRKEYKSVLQSMQLKANGEFKNTNGYKDAEEIVDRYNSICQEITNLYGQLPNVEKQIEEMNIWGEFDWTIIEALKAEGWKIGFYACPDKDFKEEWEKEYNALIITNKATKLYFVTVSKKFPKLYAEKVNLPNKSLSQLQKEKEDLKLLIENKEKECITFAQENHNNLEMAIKSLQGDIELRVVQLSSDKLADDKLRMLEGFVPEDKAKDLQSMLETTEAYFEMREAQEEDQAPIKLKNNAFVRMYELLTKMYGMPDYGEFDPTPLIAPFFTLFFGFCMGDAGYGLVLIALGFYLRHKLSDKVRGVMNLLITLGVGTTIMGAILGTFFGMELFKNAYVPEFLKEFMIAGRISGTNYDKAMLFALIIGVVNIVVAMIVKALGKTLRYGFKNSLSDWGWLVLIVGFITTGGLKYFHILSDDTSKWTFITIGAIASLGIYFFNDIKRNIFVNMSVGLLDTYNMTTGLLGDTLSYLRLYALGLAGGMLGGVFNMIGLMVKDGCGGGALGWILCGVVLILGHSMNIAMSCLSAFVHPLRLTFVEYFKNSGFNGKGEEYRPFKEIEIKK